MKSTWPTKKLGEYDPFLVHKHPDDLLKEIFILIKKIGAEKFLHSAGYNKERDGFMACLFAYAMRKFQQKEWFIQQVGDPPDFEMIALTGRATKDKPFDHAMVELVSIPQDIDKTEDKLGYVVDVLKKTKINEKYRLEEGTILLIFINASCGPILSGDLSKWVSKNKPKYFGEILCIYILSVSLEDSFIYVVKSLTRPENLLTIKLKDEFNKGIIFDHLLLRKFIKHI